MLNIHKDLTLHYHLHGTTYRDKKTNKNLLSYLCFHTRPQEPLVSGVKD